MNVRNRGVCRLQVSHLLLSCKLQNCRKIQPEAFYHRTSGFLFQKASLRKSNNDVRIRSPGAGQETNGLAQSALSKEGECPFSCGRKISLCSSFFPYQPQRGVSRLGGTASLGPVPIGRDQAKSRWVQQVKERLRRRVGKSSSTLRYMDTAVRRDEGKVVFYQAQK